MIDIDESAVRVGQLSKRMSSTMKLQFHPRRFLSTIGVAGSRFVFKEKRGSSRKAILRMNSFIIQTFGYGRSQVAILVARHFRFSRPAAATKKKQVYVRG